MKQKPILKKASILDYRKIAKIYVKEFSKPPYNEKWTTSSAIKKIKDLRRYCIVSKIIIDEKTIGFMAVNPKIYYPGTVAFIEEFAIDENYQGRGMGSDCIKLIEKEYKSKGYKYVQLMSIRNAPAYNFYKKRGYKISEDCKLLEKKL